ncbi:hypothetical protein [Streptosporangium sp. NPDC003464]
MMTQADEPYVPRRLSDPADDPQPPEEPSGCTGRLAAVLITVVLLSVLGVSFWSAWRPEDDGRRESSAHCVDLDSLGADGGYRVVDDERCRAGDDGSGRGSYGWYYGGDRTGDRVSSGSTVRPPGRKGSGVGGGDSDILSRVDEVIGSLFGGHGSRRY